MMAKELTAEYQNVYTYVFDDLGYPVVRAYGAS